MDPAASSFPCSTAFTLMLLLVAAGLAHGRRTPRAAVLVTRKAIPINRRPSRSQTFSSHRSMHEGPNCHAMLMSSHSCSLADRKMLYKYLVYFDRSKAPLHS